MTTPTHFGLLLLHWTLGEFSSRMTFPTLGGDSYVADTMLEVVLGNSTDNNEWKLAAKMTNSRVVGLRIGPCAEGFMRLGCAITILSAFATMNV